MSKATKRKHVVREVLEEFVTPGENQQIVKVTAGRGNNLHEVVTASGETYLASMPPKFRKNVWIKRGDFVVIEPIEEGDKVKAEIVQVLYKFQIRHLKQEKLWPVEFQDKLVESPKPNRTSAVERLRQEHLGCNSDNTSIGDDEENVESTDDDDVSNMGLFVNTNRPTLTYEESSSDSSTDVEN